MPWVSQEDSAFIFCTACKRSFYIELLTEESEEYPLPNTCPFCGTVGSLDDLESRLDEADAAAKVALQRAQLVVLEGGKKTTRPKEDRNGTEERSREADAHHCQQDEGGREGPGGGDPSQR